MKSLEKEWFLNRFDSNKSKVFNSKNDDKIDVFRPEMLQMKIF